MYASSLPRIYYIPKTRSEDSTYLIPPTPLPRRGAPNKGRVFAAGAKGTGGERNGGDPAAVYKLIRIVICME